MICVINCGTSFLDNIKKCLDDLDYSYKIFDLEEIKGCNFNSFSGIIISGASTLLTQLNLDEYLKPFEFIKTIDVPILGICLGHQIIGLLHGTDIGRDEMINKKEHIKIVKDDILFSDIEDNTLFQEEHSEYINLPEGFYLLAQSDSCDNEVMKHPDKNIYGTQFHPEVSDENGKILIKNFLSLCKK